MSDQPTITRAWSWSVARSPILNTWRWIDNQVHRQARANAAISGADLPAPIAKRIGAITRKTRLWPSERADIARELIAHAQDALDAGRETDDILTSLGDPKTVAKLFRRSAKRKRHWVWRARQRTVQAFIATIALLIMLYAVLFIRFNTSSPTIERDVLAELNARNDRFTQDEKANTVYRELWVAWTPLQRELYILDDPPPEHFESNATDDPPPSAIGLFPRYAPDAPFHAELTQAMDEIAPLIELARCASELPTLGSYYSTSSETVETPNGTSYDQPIPPEPNLEKRADLIAVILPDLGMTRACTNLLVYDANRAAAASDPDRALDSLSAALGLARQISDESFLITSLVAIAIQGSAEDAALRMIHDQPDLFTEKHLAALAHRIAAAAPRTRRLDMGSERLFFDDILQRVYTDDGSHPTNPDGRITPDGYALLGRISSMYMGVSDTPTAATRLAGPMTTPLIAGRRETRDRAERAYASIETLIARGPEGYGQFFEDHYQRIMYNVEYTTGGRLRHPVLAALLPALGRSADSVFAAEARTNATLAAIAANIHRLRTGSWPADLASLTPELLPELPADRFEPGTPIKSLVRDGQLFIYYAGTDGDDDQARAVPEGENPQRARHFAGRFHAGSHIGPSDGDRTKLDADWILYPPAD